MKKITFILLGLTSLTLPSCALIAIGVGSQLLVDPGNRNTGLYSDFPYQNTNSKYESKYSDQLETNSQVLRTWHHYTVEEVDSAYVLKVFRPDTKQITLYATYDNTMLFMKNGKYQEWWDNGNKREKGRYLYHKRIGEWIYYDFETGKKSSTGYFRKGVKEGKWTYFNVKTGQKIAEINLSNDKKNGPFKLFYDEKNIGKGSFFNNELDNIQWDKTATEEQKQYFITNNELALGVHDFQPPYLNSCSEFEKTEEKQSCSYTELHNSLKGNLVFPPTDEVLDIKGNAIIDFTITTEGKVENVIVKRGLSTAIEAECKRLFENIDTKWLPSEYKGEKRNYKIKNFELSFN